MSDYVNQQWILQSRPEGRVKRSDFEFRESGVRPLEEGECLLKIMYLAMNPATRAWMSSDGGYAEPLPLGGPVIGTCIGRVIESRNPQIPLGTVFTGNGQWARYMIVGPEQISPVLTGQRGILSPVDTSTGHELPMYLHAMGTSGATAYYGMMEIAGMKPGDQALVSGAAGSVGSLAAQFAKLKGASKVVGIAGGPEKCAVAVREFGCDACIDYKASADISAAIAKEFPNGLDVYLDNVGGDILEAALDHLAQGARIAICGMISQYNDTAPTTGRWNLFNLLRHRARIQGYRTLDYLGSPGSEAALLEISDWIRQGKLNARIDIRDDFENLPDVFNVLFTGGHIGRLLVKVAD